MPRWCLTARSTPWVALVQEDRLVAKSEEAVFQWCVRWWEASKRPEAELLAVMKHVRFAVMAEGFLRETVVAWPALGSAEARSMLLTAVLPAGGVTKAVQRSGFGPRLIYVVGGHDGSRNLSMYDPQNASWTQLASMGMARRNHASAAVGGKLYVFSGVGGEDDDEYLSTAEVYDPASNSWAQVTSLTSTRESLVAVAF